MGKVAAGWRLPALQPRPKRRSSGSASTRLRRTTAAAALRWAGSGLDNIDVAHAHARGVQIVRVPGSSAQPVAELTFGLLLALVRSEALSLVGYLKNELAPKAGPKPLQAGTKTTLGVVATLVTGAKSLMGLYFSLLPYTAGFATTPAR